MKKGMLITSILCLLVVVSARRFRNEESYGECVDTRHCRHKKRCTSPIAVKHCPRTCGICTPKPPCKDKYKRCDELAGKGYCDMVKMQKYCPISCNTCDGKPYEGRRRDDTRRERSEVKRDKRCEDDSKHCPAFAKKGFCTSEKTQDKMERLCRSSCHFCHMADQDTHDD